MFILAGALALPAQEPRAGAIQATASPEPLPSKVFVPYSKQRQQEIKRLSGKTILGSSIFTCPAQKELPPNGKTETRGGRPVMYTHFHQAGGTTMCRLANQLKNQEKMGDKQRGEQNCNLDADRLVTPQGTSVTCAERIDMCGPYFEGAEMKWRNVTWMQQERWVDGDSCSALYYVAMLRDPLDRIVSNVSSHTASSTMRSRASRCRASSARVRRGSPADAAAVALRRLVVAAEELCNPMAALSSLPTGT